MITPRVILDPWAEAGYPPGVRGRISQGTAADGGKMNDALLTKYANALLTAVNLREGQNLLVRGEPVHARFAGLLAREAYRRGARYVRFDNNESENPYTYAARVEHSREEFLSYVPEFRIEFLRRAIEERWALIAIRTPEDPDFLSDLDPARNAAVVKATATAMADLQRRISANEIAWLVAFMPTEKLAGRIMGMEPGTAAVEALWNVLIPILKLDAPDPSAAWVAHCDTLAARAETLNALALSEVRFVGPGTDLRIGLAERSRWRGGPDTTKDGRRFSPNIPTEEVFTSPDCRIAEGEVRFTRPVLLPSIGKIVEGGRLVIKGGVAVEWDASSGKDALDTYFAIDPGARRLGEVALVDGSSAIFKADKVFYNILFDENASCHIALGSAYPSCYEGGDAAGKEELAAIGANESSVHTDFMIGGPEVSVIGTKRAGGEVVIIEKGEFKI
jgi:aminopeptidase